MKLYIGNPTSQDMDFLYRLASGSRPSPYMLSIPAGTQMALPHDLTQEQIDKIIKHQEKYGARADEEMGRLRFTEPTRAALVPLIFRVGSPVRDASIRNVYAVNQRTLEEWSGVMAEQVAVNIEQSVREAASIVGQVPTAVEVETSLVPKKGAAPEPQRVVRVTKNEGQTRRTSAIPPQDRSTGRRAKRTA
jgi:hypothetical protein